MSETTPDEEQHEHASDDESREELSSTPSPAGGRLSGEDGRVVSVDRSGPLRDYSGATLGLNGIVSSRLGIRDGDEITWLDQLTTTRQRYVGDTTLIRTEHSGEQFTIHQWDYTLERAHLTHIEVYGDLSPHSEFVAELTFEPDGQRDQVGQFVHGDVIEVFHDVEHNYISASTGVDRIEPDADDHPSDDSISNRLFVSTPLEDDGNLAQTTLVTLLADHTETDRASALAHVRAFADHYQTDAGIRDRAAARQSIQVSDLPNREIIVDDIRAVRLLTARTGARSKLPDFPGGHASGHGYAWFRDDAEIATNLLTVEGTFGIELDDTHAQTAQFYCETQLQDGTWPQRVWAHNGSIAPGWGQARVTGNGNAYQADATAKVLVFLARYLRKHSPDPYLASSVTETIEEGLAGLISLLDEDGLPSACQNLWEQETGRFTHTAATALEAFSEIARAPLDDEETKLAREHAKTIYDGLDARWTDENRFERAPGDHGFDIATLSLVSAHRAYAAIETVDEQRLDTLRKHYEGTVAGLVRQHDDEPVGLARYERGDPGREPDADELLWPLAAAWAGLAGATLGSLLGERGRPEEASQLFGRAKEILELTVSGPASLDTGYIPEQQYSDGTPESALPFGWAHAVRCGALARLFEADELATTQRIRQPSGPAAHSTWTTGEKYGIGTACDHHCSSPSRVWFTLTEGALTEPRFPRVDLMNFRTVDFLIVDTDDDSEYAVRTHNERRTDDDIETIERSTTTSDTSAPVYRQQITETGGHRDWEFTAEYVTDPDHDTILLDITFRAADGNQYDVYVIGDVALSGYLTGTKARRIDEDSGYAVAAWNADDRESVYRTPEGESYEIATAIASQRSFDWASVCTAGDETLAGLFGADPAPEPQAETGLGHSVLVGRLGASVQSLVDTIGIGFAEDADSQSAYQEATAALDRGYVGVRDAYVSGWQSYLEDRPVPDSVASYPDLADQYRMAMIVLKAVEDKTFLGAGVASPSVPWGDDVSATEPNDYGYNFTWSRDLYQVFTALSAIDDVESARLAVEYLYEYQQRANGFLPQNTYLEGRTRWGGEQLDNVAFPSVMAYQLHQNHGLSFADVAYEYGDVRRSLEYLLRSGPRSGQERWEEESGYSPSTIAAQIAGLGCGAALADEVGRRGDALVYLAHADHWRLAVDDWCATKQGTGNDRPTPYYVRISRNGNPDSGVMRELANNGPTLDERDIIDAGFLELVRLGLRDPDDPIIQNSLDVVDDTIRVDTPNGPAWYRYNGDGYGELGERESDEGAPWSMARNGSGRLWPIFTGERGEYELAAETESGTLAPKHLLWTMQRFANEGLMIPEQVWDREYETEYGWEFGKGTGGATPLAWSMAEYVRLAHSLDAQRLIEQPEILRRRYDDGTPPEPSLRIDPVEHGEETVHISGETDCKEVVLWTPELTERHETVGGQFELEAPADAGQCTVVAGTNHDELHEVATTMEEFSW